MRFSGRKFLHKEFAIPRSRLWYVLLQRGEEYEEPWELLYDQAYISLPMDEGK